MHTWKVGDYFNWDEKSTDIIFQIVKETEVDFIFFCHSMELPMEDMLWEKNGKFMNRLIPVSKEKALGILFAAKLTS